MRTYFKLELKKTLLSWKTIIAFLVILAAFLIPYIDELKFKVTYLDGIEYFLRINCMSYFFYIGPIVAGIIYSTSIVNDKKTGFMDKLLEIIDAKTYYKVKLLINAIVTLSIFILSNLIMILYLILVYGIKNRGFQDVEAGAFVIYDNLSKPIYILLVFLIIPITLTAFSTFIFGMTTALNNKFMGYILPIFYVITTQVLFEIWNLNNIIDFNLGKIILIERFPVNILNILLYNLVLILLGVSLIYKFGYKRTLSSLVINNLK